MRERIERERERGWNKIEKVVCERRNNRRRERVI